MPDLLLIAAGLVAAGLLVLLPLRGPRGVDDSRDALETAEVRHRAALEALRDVEADRRAGSLDDASYAEQLAEAEARAAATRAALEHPPEPPLASPRRDLRPAAAATAVVLGAVLLVGAAVPATGIGNRTEVDQALAEARAAESARQDRIRDLTEALRTDPSDTETLSDLADAYLAGSGEDDLVAAASALQVLIALDPERPDAYERIMTAYLRAGDYANARAAHGSYVELEAADPAEAAFFDGLIALRGEDDPDRAATAFERFLELSPDDPRAGMVRGLIDEADATP